MSVQFELQPDRATAAINRWMSIPATTSVITVHPHDWAHGSISALYSTELLAAQAGIVPFIKLPNGEEGIATIGAARSKLASAPAGVATIYRAMQATVRRTHATAQPATGNAPTLDGLLEGHPIGDALWLAGLDGDPELGALPLIPILVACVAVAGIIATAWYMKQEAKLEVEGKNARFIASMSQIASLGREQLRTTGKLDPDLYASLTSVAEHDTSSSALPWLAAGGVLASAAGGAYLWNRMKSR